MHIADQRFRFLSTDRRGLITRHRRARPEAGGRLVIFSSAGHSFSSITVLAMFNMAALGGRYLYFHFNTISSVQFLVVYCPNSYFIISMFARLGVLRTADGSDEL